MMALKIRRFVRKLAGAWKHCPVEVVEGNAAPHIAGKSYYWTTPSGRLVYYPSAYRRAFGRPVYIPSSIRVEVGAEWLKKNVCRVQGHDWEDNSTAGPGSGTLDVECQTCGHSCYSVLY